MCLFLPFSETFLCRSFLAFLVQYSFENKAGRGTYVVHSVTKWETWHVTPLFRVPKCTGPRNSGRGQVADRRQLVYNCARVITRSLQSISTNVFGWVRTEEERPGRQNLRPIGLAAAWSSRLHWPASLFDIDRREYATSTTARAWLVLKLGKTSGQFACWMNFRHLWDPSSIQVVPRSTTILPSVSN
jgi:hypothetical protein